MAFTVINIDQTCKIILESGGSMINKPAQSSNGKVKVAYCYDPEGILIEIVEVL